MLRSTLMLMVVVCGINVFLINRNLLVRYNNKRHSTGGNTTFEIWRYPHVNCFQLLEGNEAEMKRTTEKRVRLVSVPDKDFVELMRDCAQFKKQRNYYTETSLSQDERSLPIAFSILINKTSYFDQAERLLRAIYRPHNTYCIHVDAKSDVDTFNAALSLANCFPNVFLSETRAAMNYGTSGTLNADISCMKRCFNKDSRWRYYINLIPEMFPLRTNLELVKILKIYNGSNDVSMETILSLVKRRKDSVSHYHYVPLHIHPPPGQIGIVKGKMFGTFSRAFVEYLLRNETALKFQRWAENVFGPETVFYSSLNCFICNPHLQIPGSYKGAIRLPHRHPVNYLSVHYLRHPLQHGCLGGVSRGICVPGVRDLPRLYTRPELFVYKLMPYDFDSVVMECLDEWLTNRINQEQFHENPMFVYYYNELRSVKIREQDDMYKRKGEWKDFFVF